MLFRSFGFGFSIFDTLEKFSNCQYIDKPHVVATSNQQNMNEQKKINPKTFQHKMPPIMGEGKALHRFTTAISLSGCDVNHPMYILCKLSLGVMYTSEDGHCPCFVCIHSSSFIFILSIVFITTTPPSSSPALFSAEYFQAVIIKLLREGIFNRSRWAMV